jgi:hypothetical protein
MTTNNFCFNLQNRLIQTSKKEVNGTVILPPLVFPVCINVYHFHPSIIFVGKIGAYLNGAPNSVVS